MKKILFVFLCCAGLAACNKDNFQIRNATKSAQPIRATYDTLLPFTGDELRLTQFYAMPKKTNIWYEVKKDSAFVEDATAITYDSTIVHRFVIDSLEKGRLVDIRPLSVTGHITTATTLYISFGTDTLEFKISRAPELDSTYTISALKWRKEGDSKENSLWPKAAIGQLMYAGELCFFDNNLELYVDRLSFPKKDLIDTEEKGIDVKKIK